MSCSPPLSRPKSAGQLFLLLQYQALASRIKVLVRKAENLGRLTRIPGTPGRTVQKGVWIPVNLRRHSVLGEETKFLVLVIFVQLALEAISSPGLD